MVKQWLIELLHTECPDIILCQETKVDQHISSNELFPKDFIVTFRKIRKKRRRWRLHHSQQEIAGNALFRFGCQWSWGSVGSGPHQQFYPTFYLPTTWQRIRLYRALTNICDRSKLVSSWYCNKTANINVNVIVTCRPIYGVCCVGGVSVRRQHVHFAGMASRAWGIFPVCR